MKCKRTTWPMTFYLTQVQSLSACGTSYGLRHASLAFNALSVIEVKNNQGYVLRFIRWLASGEVQAFYLLGFVVSGFARVVHVQIK